MEHANDNQPKFEVGQIWVDKGNNKIRILCTDRPGNYPIVGMDEKGGITTHKSTGIWSAYPDTSRDLVKPYTPPATKTCYVALYKETASFNILWSNYNVLSACLSKPIAVKKITITEGEGLDEKGAILPETML